MTTDDRPLTWTASVPILGSPIILRQLGLAIGLPFGILIVVLLVAGRGSRDSWYGVALVIGLLGMTAIVVRLVYGGRYSAEFRLDEHGALARLAPIAANRSRRMARLTMVAGALAGQPAAVGAGVLAAGNQGQYLAWSEVRRVDEDAKHRTIVLRGPMASHVAIFATPKNVDLVRSRVARYIGDLPPTGAR